MKFKDIFEMPTFRNKELPVTDFKVHVVSVDTLDRDYKLLGTVQAGNKKIIAGFKRDRSIAIIGPAVVRNDGKASIEVVAQIEFHPGAVEGEAGGRASLQISLVEALDNLRGFGYGYQLYKMLLNNGYTIVSDNVQYVGGKELWLKIVRKSATELHNVFITEYGKYIRDEAGNPIAFDGANISPEDIWSTDTKSEKHFYTLLVAKNI